MAVDMGGVNLLDFLKKGFSFEVQAADMILSAA